ncbi:MAG: lactonase family protein [Acidobacteriaceae bacterium]
MRFHRIIVLLAVILGMFWQGCSSGSGGGGGRGFINGSGNAASYLLYTDFSAGAAHVAAIGTSGTLTAIGGAIQVGVGPIAITATPNGKFVYVLNTSSATVTQFAVAADGTLTQPQVAAGTGLQPSAIAVDPQSRFVLVANQGSGAGASVSVFSINASTGGLTAIGTAIPLNVTDPKAIAISGNFVYIAGSNKIDVMVFNPSASTFTFEGNSPFSAGPVSTDITAIYSPPQQSNLLYATDESTDSLLSFALDGGGVLSGTATTLTGSTPVAMVAGNQNRLLFVANQGSGDVSIFIVDPTTGAIAPAATPKFAVGSAPNALAYDPVNNFLAVGLSGTKQIAMFGVNTSTGGLSTLGSNLAVTNAASGLAVAKP